MGLAQCSFISTVGGGGGQRLPSPKGSNPSAQSFSVAHSHDPSWLLLAPGLAAALLLHTGMVPTEGQEGSFVFPSLISPSETQLQEGQGRAEHPQQTPPLPTHTPCWTWVGHPDPAGAGTGQNGILVGGCQAWAG